MLWQHLGHTVAAVNVSWLGFEVALVSVYALPLTDPYRVCLVEVGLLPKEAVALTGVRSCAGTARPLAQIGTHHG